MDAFEGAGIADTFRAFVKVALCREFSKFYAEEEERLNTVRAVLERMLKIKLPRLKIDVSAKRGRNPRLMALLTMVKR